MSEGEKLAVFETSPEFQEAMRQFVLALHGINAARGKRAVSVVIGLVRLDATATRGSQVKPETLTFAWCDKTFSRADSGKPLQVECAELVRDALTTQLEAGLMVTPEELAKRGAS